MVHGRAANAQQINKDSLGSSRHKHMTGDVVLPGGFGDSKSVFKGFSV